MALEKLYRPFMPLSLLPGIEGAQILVFMGLWIDFPRIKPKLARSQFANHGMPPVQDVTVEISQKDTVQNECQEQI
jgi:hypothetical protein